MAAQHWIVGRIPLPRQQTSRLVSVKPNATVVMSTYSKSDFVGVEDNLELRHNSEASIGDNALDSTACLGTIRSDSAGGRPTVLIVTDRGNEQFDQLACTLRRCGVRVVRVRSPPRRQTQTAGPAARTRWLRDCWFYDACLTLAERGGALSFDGKALRRDRIVDVLVNEPTLSAAGLSGSALSDLAARGLACSRLPPSVLLDKFALNAVLRDSGIGVPAQLDAREVTPSQAVERLGLPLLVKDRVGAGGEGVRAASTLQEVELAVQELTRRQSGSVFYQQHINGEMVMYGALIGDRGPIIEHGLKVAAAQWALGPSARVAMFDDPDLLAAGRAAAAVLGCRGFIELGFLRDRDSRLWHIDANCRSWGNMISLLQVGIDYTAAYVAMVTNAPQPASVAVAPSGEADVLPFSLYAAVRKGGWRKILGSYSTFVDLCRRGPGWRYGAVISMKTTVLLGVRGAKELLRVLQAAAHVRPARPTSARPG